MPLINVKVLEGVFDEEQKRRIVTSLSEAMIAIEGEHLRPLTVVVVEEVKSGDWAVGGKALTTQDALALAAGRGGGARPRRERVARPGRPVRRRAR